jgi:hypothetical protein
MRKSNIAIPNYAIWILLLSAQNKDNQHASNLTSGCFISIAFKILKKN